MRIPTPRTTCWPGGSTRPGFTLVTQNVDGLHERAGSADVLRLHGSIWDLRCADGCAGGRAGRRDLEAPLASLPPRCRHCDGLERPGVVWFGESLDAAMLGRAAEAAAACDVFLAVGTSARGLSGRRAGRGGQAAGATTIEINPDETPMAPYLDLAVRQPAERVPPRADALLRG